MRHLKFVVNCALVVSSIGAFAQDSARTVQYHSQDIVPIRAKVKYTTLIELPTTEKIMEAATGDKEFWIVDVVGNFCFVHPAKQGISSNLNIMLIARQKPDATNVAGLRAWNSLGRFVKRGEKGIFILAPMVGRRSTKDVATDEPSQDATTEGQRTLYGFRAVYIFDISQTEGKELPTLTEVNGDVSGYRERLFKFVEAQSVELTFSERIAPAKGLSYGGKITLLSGMQPAEEFSTLVHEIAHEMLHRGDRRTLTTKQVRETEAEAVAFVVCQSVGLQNGTASQDYIQLWHGDASLLRESLEAVQQTAAVILGGIAPEPAALAAAA